MAVCIERAIRQLLLMVRNSATVLDMTGLTSQVGIALDALIAIRWSTCGSR